MYTAIGLEVTCFLSFGFEFTTGCIKIRSYIHSLGVLAVYQLGLGIRFGLSLAIGVHARRSFRVRVGHNP